MIITRKHTIRKRSAALVLAILLVINLVPLSVLCVQAHPVKNQDDEVHQENQENQENQEELGDLEDSGDVEDTKDSENVEDTKDSENVEDTKDSKVLDEPEDKENLGDEEDSKDSEEIEKLTMNPDINVLNHKYIGKKQNLITGIKHQPEGAKVEYSIDNKEWTTDIPQAMDVGEYTVYVKISRKGYITYESGEKVASIFKCDIEGIGIKQKKLVYSFEQPQKLVDIEGVLEKEDSVTWSVNDNVVKGIPTATNVGKYIVAITVDRGANYNKFTQKVTTVISNAKMDLKGLKVNALEGEYTAEAQEVVTISGQKDKYTLQYKLGDTMEEGNWNNQIPTVIDAGQYTVWVKAVQENYHEQMVKVIAAQSAVAPYNVYIAKAKQTLEFTNNEYNTKESSIAVSDTELKEGKSFNFSATDVKGLVGRKLTYTVESTDNIAEIDQDGNLKVTGAGTIIITASLAGNPNYQQKEIKHILKVEAKKDTEEVNGKFVSFPNPSIDYTLGNKDGISENIASKSFKNDQGILTYQIKDGDNLGLMISQEGIVSIQNYQKVMRAIEASVDKKLVATVEVKKAETKLGNLDRIKYPEDTATYTLNVSLSKLPEQSYKLYDNQEPQHELSKPNGTNEWYNTVVEVKPTDGYSIVQADQITEQLPKFKESIQFENVKSEEGVDEANKVLDRTIYLQNNETGEITEKADTLVKYVDNVKPNNLNIIFPDSHLEDDIRYYGDKIEVIFEAYDTTSGIAQFNWKYGKIDDASTSNLLQDNGQIDAVLDTTDPSNSKYTGTLILPKEEAVQMKGNLQVSAVDYAGNVSSTYTDNGIFVVDTIAPHQSVSYQLKDGEGSTQVIDNTHYFSNDVEFTFGIVEANFFPEDIKIMIFKNGKEQRVQTLQWRKGTQQDEYNAMVMLDEEGNYEIAMEYKDRSGKVMEPYKSETIVVDKTIPEVSFEYQDYTDNTAPQVGTLTIKEHNFRVSDLQVEVVAKDITGKDVSIKDLQQCLHTCEWKTEGDVHTTTISKNLVDAVYGIVFEYSDLALNKAAECKSGEFIVDHTKPNIENMNVTYSQPLVETILSTITLGFYNPNVTVELTAYDYTSGIEYFIWNYNRGEQASDKNIKEYPDSKVLAKQDKNNKAKYTATITLPKNEVDQIRGGIAFTATDKCNNVSDKFTDNNHVLVVDTISPTMTIEYTEPDNISNDIHYYNKKITADFTITEANFFPEDVKVKLQKNHKEIVEVTPTWLGSSGDIYTGRYIIEAPENHKNDGDYVFIIEYKDRSNNAMTTYKSETKVIDTVTPVIAVSYSNTKPIQVSKDFENHNRKYFDKANTATIEITEHNFNPSQVKFNILAKDVSGEALNVESLYQKSKWKTEGDIHTMNITYPGDANYTFDVSYEDLATIEAENYEADYFTVDTTKPKNLKISYSKGVLDTVLNGLPFSFYRDKTVITITATDSISSISKFQYSYLAASGVSGSTEAVNCMIAAKDIILSDGNKTGTATFTIPTAVLGENRQFNGTVNFLAIDRASNESEHYKNSKRIVVDNLSPTATVQYNAPAQEVNKVAYYDKEIHANITIHENNFYPEDMEINISKDGEVTGIKADWSSNENATHTGTFVLSEDGKYQITMSYVDKSGNQMQDYKSEEMILDNKVVETNITINGGGADGRAFKDDLIPKIYFEDENFESYKVKLLRTSYTEKNKDVTNQFIGTNIITTEKGGSGIFDTFDSIAENDGIYTLIIETKDKAGHITKKDATFTVNRFGSVYEYSDYLTSLIANGGTYIQNITEDLVISEYNADQLVTDSLKIEITKDGRPLDKDSYELSSQMDHVDDSNKKGWYQYTYTVSKNNFKSDGVYKVSISSEDETGNNPENTNYENMEIVFRVDQTPPEITSIVGLEETIVNAPEQTVKYSVYDTMGLKSVVIYVDNKEVANVTDFQDDFNDYSSFFKLEESENIQNVRLVVTDIAGNVTDTTKNDFKSAYAFSQNVTVSTNVLVRLLANETAVYSVLIGGVAIVCLGILGIILIRKKSKQKH